MARAAREQGAHCSCQRQQPSTDLGYALARDGAHESAWSSNGETTGAYLQFDWPSPQTVQSLIARGWISAVERVTSAKITFSDGSEWMVGDIKPDASALPARLRAQKRDLAALHGDDGRR